MVKRYIDIPDNEWGIILVYDFDTLDFDDMWAICKAFGMSELNIKKSLRILSTYNSGMTVSSDELRMSAVFVGRASSRSQFWNTVGHEVVHLVDAIADHFGTECGSEEHAYLQGFIFQRIVEEIAEPSKY